MSSTKFIISPVRAVIVLAALWLLGQFIWSTIRGLAGSTAFVLYLSLTSLTILQNNNPSCQRRTGGILDAYPERLSFKGWIKYQACIGSDKGAAIVDVAPIILLFTLFTLWAGYKLYNSLYACLAGYFVVTKPVVPSQRVPILSADNAFVEGQGSLAMILDEYRRLVNDLGPRMDWCEKYHRDPDARLAQYQKLQISELQRELDQSNREQHYQALRYAELEKQNRLLSSDESTARLLETIVGRDQSISRLEKRVEELSAQDLAISLVKAKKTSVRNLSLVTVRLWEASKKASHSETALSECLSETQRLSDLLAESYIKAASDARISQENILQASSEARQMTMVQAEAAYELRREETALVARDAGQEIERLAGALAVAERELATRADVPCQQLSADEVTELGELRGAIGPLKKNMEASRRAERNANNKNLLLQQELQGVEEKLESAVAKNKKLGTDLGEARKALLDNISIA